MSCGNQSAAILWKTLDPYCTCIITLFYNYGKLQAATLWTKLNHIAHIITVCCNYRKLQPCFSPTVTMEWPWWFISNTDMIEKCKNMTSHVGLLYYGVWHHENHLTFTTRWMFSVQISVAMQFPAGMHGNMHLQVVCSVLRQFTPVSLDTWFCTSADIIGREMRIDFIKQPRNRNTLCTKYFPVLKYCM